MDKDLQLHYGSSIVDNCYMYGNISVISFSDLLTEIAELLNEMDRKYSIEKQCYEEFYNNVQKVFENTFVYGKVLELAKELPKSKTMPESIDIDCFNEDMCELIVKLSYANSFEKILRTELPKILNNFVEPIAYAIHDLMKGDCNALRNHLFTSTLREQIEKLSVLTRYSQDIPADFFEDNRQKNAYDFLCKFYETHEGRFDITNDISQILDNAEHTSLSELYDLGMIDDIFRNNAEMPKHIYILREMDKSVLLKKSESRPLYIEDMDKYFQAKKLNLNLDNHIVPSIMTMCEELGKSNNPKYEELVRWYGDYCVYEPNAKGETIMDAYLEMKDIALVTINADGGFVRTTVTALKEQEGRDDNDDGASGSAEREKTLFFEDDEQERKRPILFPNPQIIVRELEEDEEEYGLEIE